MPISIKFIGGIWSKLKLLKNRIKGYSIREEIHTYMYIYIYILLFRENIHLHIKHNIITK